METLTVEEAEQNLKELLKLAHEENRQFCITTESGKVVLLSEERYQNLIVTLELLATPGLMNGISVLEKS